MLKVLQINTLDLFIFLDFPLTQDVKNMSEDQWQSMTYSNKKNKPLWQLYGLAEMINRQDPDVIVLNEVGGEESLINFNKLFLQNSYTVAIAPGSSWRGIDNGFLVKPHLNHSINGITKVKINKEPIFFSRSVNQLTLMREGKAFLNVFAVHLKSQRGQSGDYESIITRYNEVKALVHLLKDYESSDTPFIVAGDFNGYASGKDQTMEFDQIYDNLSIRDIHDLNQTKEENKFSYVYFDSLGPNYNQIDYIFLSKGLHDKIQSASNGFYLKNEIETYATNLKEKESLPSDHYPQIVILKI